MQENSETAAEAPVDANVGGNDDLEFDKFEPLDIERPEPEKETTETPECRQCVSDSKDDGGQKEVKNEDGSTTVTMPVEDFLKAFCGQGKDEPPKKDFVAIPYIKDGNVNVQLFFGSMFHRDGELGPVEVAERYFIDKFKQDDEPKWDGVFVCMYDFENCAILKDERNVSIDQREFLAKWIGSMSGSMDDVTFNVKCTMPKKWASHFQSLLRRMEEYGSSARSGHLAFNADGAGEFRPKFRFSTAYHDIRGRVGNLAGGAPDELFDAL